MLPLFYSIAVLITRADRGIGRGKPNVPRSNRQKDSGFELKVPYTSAFDVCSAENAASISEAINCKFGRIHHILDCARMNGVQKSSVDVTDALVFYSLPQSATIISFSKSVALDLGHKVIRASINASEAVRTRTNLRILAVEFGSDRLGEVMLNKIAESRNITDLKPFLLSDELRYINRGAIKPQPIFCKIRTER
jgi:hypothetical protein